MKDKILKLLEVKSIISIITALVFSVLALKGVLGSESVMSVIVLVFNNFFNQYFFLF